MLGGAFALTCAALDWDWFMNRRKAQLFCKLLGRGGARIFYGVLGAALLGFGICIVSGVVPVK